MAKNTYVKFECNNMNPNIDTLKYTLASLTFYTRNEANEILPVLILGCVGGKGRRNKSDFDIKDKVELFILGLLSSTFTCNIQIINPVMLCAHFFILFRPMLHMNDSMMSETDCVTINLHSIH